ncbi:hypothetical protein BDR26DRAFT_517839 [Obelidium mucronatum]|nr:hypothetical protein BDR26DRAFT_517839 [Obelidium mucronatum]
MTGLKKLVVGCGVVVAGTMDMTMTFSINRLGLSAEQQKPLNWTNEILASQESVNEPAVNDEDYAIMEEDAFHEFYNATGTGSTMGNLNPLYYEAREKEWEDLSMSWNSIGEGQQSQSGNVQQSQQDLSFGYDFIPNNPYISHPLQHLRDVGSHANLSESILSLEAAVQVDPMDATTWKNLGLRQQENENEVAAISALRKAIELDPTLLDSWIALSVSYTNDSLYSEAYKALEGWIQNNESYSHLLKNSRSRHKPTRISHEFVS